MTRPIRPADAPPYSCADITADDIKWIDACAMTLYRDVPAQQHNLMETLKGLGYSRRESWARLDYLHRLGAECRDVWAGAETCGTLVQFGVAPIKAYLIVQAIVDYAREE